MSWNSPNGTPRWISAALKKAKLRRWLVAIPVFTIVNALMLTLWSWDRPVSENISAVAEFNTFNISKGCPGRFQNLPDPDYEIDANVADVFLHGDNYGVISLPQWNHDEGPAFYVKMNEVFITGHSLKAYNCHVVYFGGGCALWPDPYPIDELRHFNQDQITRIDRAIVISQHFGYAYYHWMIEALPRLVMMYDYIQADPSMKIIMFETEIPEVGPTILRLLDVDPDRVIWYHSEHVYYVRDVTIPSPAQCGKAISTAIRSLRNLMRSKLMEKYPAKFSIKAKAKIPFTILIQNRGKLRRSLTNHHDLVRAITAANKDAQVIVFGQKESFLSMASKHFYADVIIGPHGAGLSNVILAPDGATLVEIHPNEGNQYDEGPHFVNSCHQRTARRSGLRSVMLLEDNGDTANAFTANISRVVDTVQKIRAGDFEHIDQYVSWQL